MSSKKRYGDSNSSSNESKNPILAHVRAKKNDIYNAMSENEINMLSNDLHAKLGGNQMNRFNDENKSNESFKGVRDPSNPAVSIENSITEDYIIMLEDGKRFTSITRALRQKYNMTPEEYREKWKLPEDYPMHAPSYANSRLSHKKSINSKNSDDNLSELVAIRSGYKSID
jgi:predicted transcriptional regulator